ncbi:protein kinase domain-containing protein [Pleionea sediminis]|uniref:protein kinase domain-containing protein n=1 Tax=Pleionea sediminis TaxID=2569479 RepID=UPI0013DDCADD|nr:protein kinase [Pleionea sediminis]
MKSENSDKASHDKSDNDSNAVRNNPSSRPVVEPPSEENAYVRPPSRPKNIGRYKVIEELGRGAMAYVYKAYDPEIDRFLAVKVLREELANDDDYRAGFIHEAKLAGQLAHPGIVTVYDVGVADDKPYIAMELLDGVPLDELLKKRHRLSVGFTVSILVQLTRALYYAHKQGVTHRDIKPGNIMCLSDNKTVKLTDFGIAQLDDSLASTGKVQEKVLGTPEFMSPEQVLGQSLDARSDLYSLGTLIYSVITGATPFQADDYGELFRQIIKDKPPAMKVEGTKIPDELGDIVRKLLQKHPDRRYQNAALLMRDIKELLAVMESQAKEQSRPGFVSLRLRWTLGMAGLVTITMLMGLLIVYYQQYNAMRSLAMDFGFSTSRLIAFEVAEPVLMKDNVALDAIVGDIKRTQDIEYISIRNQSGVVMASTSVGEVGKPAKLFSKAELVETTSNAAIYSRQVTDSHKVFDVDTAITFQDKEIGRVMISVSADKLVQSAKLTLVIMIALMIVTLVAVFSMTLAFARQISSHAKRLALALERIRRGQFNRRLSVERNDEFGQVSFTFNQMAESLEKRFHKGGKQMSGETENLQVSRPGGDVLESTIDDESTVELKKK